MTPHPVLLTDAQMKLIREAARTAPQEWRGRLLEAIADRLLAFDALTDDAVSEAVRSVLITMFGGRAA